MTENLEKRITMLGQKKILACDGGGILGLMSIEILSKLEADLRLTNGAPNLRLCHYFDFVCGTSTGSIIAACIAAGMSTEQIRKFYVDSGQHMFEKASLIERLHYSYSDKPLARKLQDEFSKALGSDSTLGSPGLHSVLMMVMRNATTDSPWLISNNPFSKYNQRNRSDCNLKLPLWQLVRASSAAPTFFPPEVLKLGDGKNAYTFVFVDGGVTTYNNAAFLAFQVATASPYKMNWATGTDKMLIVSIGTGNAARVRPTLGPSEMWLLDNAKSIPGALMNAASTGWDMACRIMGECRFGGSIDNELGDLVCGSESNFTGVKNFAYVRYDPDVTQSGLDALGLSDVKAANVQTLDSIAHIREIQRIGEAYAQKYVKTSEHLHGFLSSHISIQ